MNAPNSNLIIDGLFLCDHRRLAGETNARDGSAVARALNSQDNRTSEFAYGPLRRRSGSPTRSGRGELALAASTTRRTRTPSQSETVRGLLKPGPAQRLGFHWEFVAVRHSPTACCQCSSGRPPGAAAAGGPGGGPGGLGPQASFRARTRSQTVIE